MARIRAIDLFCGIGGLTHGLIKAGIPVVAGIDIDKSCDYAYTHNNHCQFIQKDVEKITKEEIQSFFQKADIRILVGCAPCQPFSKYTQRYRKSGHTGNKWKLLNSFSRLICELHPEIISMENVPELAKQTIFQDFVQILHNENYHVHWQFVFCPDYGVPQARKRLVLLASSLGAIQLLPPLYKTEDYLTVRDAIGKLPPLLAGEFDLHDPLHCSARLSQKNLMRIANSKPGGTWREWGENLKLNCHKKTSGGNYSSVYGRMVWDEPAPTITTQFYGYGNGRFGHPEQNRALSIREGAILQSFPADYDFIPPGSKISKKKLGIHIGNAVPVNLGKAIGLSIQHHIEEVGLNG